MQCCHPYVNDPFFVKTLHAEKDMFVPCCGQPPYCAWSPRQHPQPPTTHGLQQLPTLWTRQPVVSSQTLPTPSTKPCPMHDRKAHTHGRRHEKLHRTSSAPQKTKKVSHFSHSRTPMTFQCQSWVLLSLGLRLLFSKGYLVFFLLHCHMLFLNSLRVLHILDVFT